MGIQATEVRVLRDLFVMAIESLREDGVAISFKRPEGKKNCRIISRFGANSSTLGPARAAEPKLREMFDALGLDWLEMQIKEEVDDG